MPECDLEGDELRPMIERFELLIPARTQVIRLAKAAISGTLEASLIGGDAAAGIALCRCYHMPHTTCAVNVDLPKLGAT
jgi:hypothetical protein